MTETDHSQKALAAPSTKQDSGKPHRRKRSSREFHSRRLSLPFKHIKARHTQIVSHTLLEKHLEQSDINLTKSRGKHVFLRPPHRCPRDCRPAIALLRLKIWKYALRGPRIIKVQTYFHRFETFCGGPLVFQRDSSLRTLNHRGDNIHLHSICKEAR